MRPTTNKDLGQIPTYAVPEDSAPLDPQLRALQEIVQNLRRPDGSRRLGRHDYEETHALQAKLFQRGQDEGSLRSFDTHYMAVTYQGAVDTMLAYLDSHPGTDAGELATAVADILLSGMAANQP